MTAEYPGARWVPASTANYGYPPPPPIWKAVVIHTPEEPADAVESTPIWFQNPAAQASTHFYVSDDGAVYQMVPMTQGAWAQGTRDAERVWKGVAGQRPPWAEAGVSYNVRAVGIEVEGYAATIGATLVVGGPQWRSLVALIRWLATPDAVTGREGFVLDRDHVCGHAELNNGKRDPGPAFPWAALMRDLMPIDVPAALRALEAFYTTQKRLLGG